MADWTPGDLCQVRRGKRWVDAEVMAVVPWALMLAVGDRSVRILERDIGTSVRPRPAPRGKLPEPVLVGGFAGHAPGRPTTFVVSRVDHVRREIEVRPVPKPTTARSKDYLAHVRTFPCCSCGATEAIHAHHVASGGMGQKASDYLTAPLCGPCHQHWHATASLPDPLGPNVHDGRHSKTFGRSRAVMWEAAARCLEEWITREGER